MAVTFIYPVRVTGQNSINYDTEAKEAKIEKNKNDSKDSLNYIMRDKKGNTYELSSEYMEKMRAYISIDEKGKVTFKTVSSFLNCSEKNTYAEWERIRELKNPKNGKSGNLQYCIVQNFGEDIDPAIANEIGVKFAEEYLSQYQCVVSTHINTGHVHNHIEFNATSFLDGKKYNDCLKSIKDIRELSDRLCEEYNLEVLEGTKEFNYIVYKDANGKTKVYEPTERKNEIKEGEYANKNDYRNTEQYAGILARQKDHHEILKEDIDRLLPHVSSYEDLLKQLENVGYDIKAKTKDGSWKKHISFKLPDWEKYTRDSHLGEEYTREYLVQKIEENLKQISEMEDKNNFRMVDAGADEKNEPVNEQRQFDTPDDVQNEDIYIYGRIVIEDIDEEYRYRKKKDADNYERIIKKQITGMEANKIEAQKKAIRAGYDPSTINHDLIHSLEQGEELLDDMMNKNQKMFFVSIMLMVGGETLDELDDNAKILMSKARKYTCQIQVFDNQQRDAFKAVLPMGIPTANKIYVERTLTTESTSIFIPFSSQELFQVGGFYYGLNQVSKNLVLCNRLKMKTPSGFVLGSSGSGKSFKCKEEMLQVLLSDDKTNLLIIDPENEYTDFGKAFGASVLSLSASSDCYINPLDMDENYGLDDKDDPLTTPLERKKEKALQKKSEYLMSIIQYMVMDTANNMGGIKPRQKSMIDRAISRTYQNYLDHNFDPEYIPTLLELQDEFDKEKDTEDGREIAEAVEYYTRGSMNLFSHKSNIDFGNRFMIFTIRDLGAELKQISLLITLDFIWNRMIANCQSKIRTYCYVDEIHVLFQNVFSERYLQQLYKRGRKYGLVITGITQDVEELLRSEMARGMLSNSDYILMLNQSSENLKLLQGLLGISQAQANYITMADVGSGLLFAEKTIVPFIDQFPEDSYLYTLMSTMFGEETSEDIMDFIERIQREQEMREQEEAEEMLQRELRADAQAV